MHPTRARELLSTELDALDQRVRFAEEAAAGSAEGDEPGTGTGLHEHAGDLGSEMTNHMENEGLLRTVQEQRRRVQAALSRIDAGTFGRCAVCGVAIDQERLEARPEVTTCREHADSPVSA